MKKVAFLTIVLCGVLWLIKTVLLALGDTGSMVVLIGLLSWFIVSAEKHERELIKLRRNGGKYPYGTYWPGKYDKYARRKHK